MSLRSMTGFARQSTQTGGFEALYEIKSVNARGLDLRVRVPSILDGFDIRIRKHVARRLSRGAVAVTLSLSPTEDADALRVDEGRLAQLIAAARKFEACPGVLPARIDGLLALPGIVSTEAAPLEDAARETLEDALLAALDMALAALEADRAREGDALGGFLSEQLDAIDTLRAQAAGLEGAQLPAIRNRIAARLAELLAGREGLSPERLDQEAAMLAMKQDIREELDRLATHTNEARNLLAAGSPAGRRLDFLAQELNREANTLGAKSADTALTGIGLALKSAIEQFREQCQNVE